MITDDELIVISEKVDKFISLIISEHQVPALELSAVILARMILLNNALSNQKDFRNLLNAITDKPILNDLEKVNIH